MTWFSTILVYVVLWWLEFFMLLLVGARSFDEAGEEVQSGNVESAPLRPRIGRKALMATLLAAVITLPVWFMVDSGLIDFRP